MGRDCSLFVFPPKRFPRRCSLDRWRYMDGVYEALGVDACDSYSERVPAHRMLVALETAAPLVCEDRPDLMENAAHWRKIGADYLRCAMKKWGQDVPTMVCEEEVFAEDYAPKAVVERLTRRRKHRARVASHAKEKQDRQQNAIVQDWLTERRAHQYDGTPALSFPEYLAQRKSSGGEGLEREGETASGEEPRKGYATAQTPPDSGTKDRDYALPAKPRYTQACNHCGICCALALCQIGEKAYPGQSAPCPALVVLEGQAKCGIVMMEERAGLEPIVRKVLGIGCGCSMEDDDTTEEQAADFDARSRAMVFGHNGKDQAQNGRA